MTAPQEHIDAVAQVIRSHEYPPVRHPWPSDDADVYRGMATGVLTDPTLIPAMLDALTRHGVLTEEWASRNASGGAAIFHNRKDAEWDAQMWEARRLWPSIDEPPMLPSTGVECRLVTRWEVAP